MSKSEVDRKGWNWAPVPADVIMSKSLSHIDVRIYSYLLWRSGKKGLAWPNTKTISEDIGASDPAIRRSFKNLIKDHWIFRLRRFGHSSITYIFERQSDCLKFSRSAHQGYDDQLTGDTTISSQVIRPNKSHRTRIKEVPAQKTRRSNPLFDALVEVTGSDPKAAGSYVGKTANDLRAYTPELIQRAYGVNGWWYTVHCAGMAPPPRPSLAGIAKTIKQASEYKTVSNVIKLDVINA